MGLISGCRYLKVNLKAKMYIYVNSTIQRCPNKIIKLFLIEEFFHLPPVSTTPVVTLELRISPRIFRKIRNGPNGILWGWGETDWWMKPGARNLVTLSLLRISSSYPLFFHRVDAKPKSYCKRGDYSNFFSVHNRTFSLEPGSDSLAKLEAANSNDFTYGFWGIPKRREIQRQYDRRKYSETEEKERKAFLYI